MQHLFDQFYHFSPIYRRTLLVTFISFGIVSFTGITFAILGKGIAHSDLYTPVGNTGMSVLAAESEANDVRFMVNVPSVFQERAIFENGITVSPDLTLNGKLILSEGAQVEADELNLGDGSIIAGNVLYSIEAGSGLSITEGQTPTITNTGVLSIGGKTGAVTLEEGSGIDIDGVKITNSDTGSSQKIFKTIVIGAESFSAGSNTDSLEFVAGSGVTLTADTTNKKITIASTGGGGSGVTTLNGLDGGLTISNTTGSGTTITIDDASTTAKGIASFNSSNFSVSSGAVNLVQNIGTSASPSFSGLTLSALTTNGGLLYTNGSGVLSQLGVGTSGYVLTSNGSGSAPSWQALTPSQWTTSGSDIYYSTGNVGIGTSSPAQPLDVNGNIRSSDGTFVTQIRGDSGGPRITFGDTSDVASMFSIGAYSSVNNIDTKGRNLRIFSTSDTTGLTYLASSGNVGIGTTSPIGLLHLTGAKVGKALFTVNETGDQALFTASSSGTTKFIVANSGNVGIGTTNTSNPLSIYAGSNTMFSVTSLGVVSAYNYFQVGSTTFSNGAIGTFGSVNLGFTTGTGYFAFNPNGVERVRIDNNGNVGIGTTSVPNKLTLNAALTADSNALALFTVSSATQKALVLQGYTSQSANIQEWQTSDGNLIAGVSPSQFYVANVAASPSYNNTGGTGSRTSIITVTTDITFTSGAASELVDGVTGSFDILPPSGMAVSSKHITFDFGSSKVITEARFYGPTGCGTWKWQGSNDNSSYTDIGSTFTLTNGTLNSMSANSTGYRYYRILGVSGTVCYNWWNEFEFKIANPSTSGNTYLSGGYVGIGTSTLTHKLNVSGTEIGKALVMLNETGTNDILAASASGTTKFRINNSGQLYMADGSAPSTTTNMLYSVGGSLYWAGQAVAVGNASQWTTSSSDIYYNTGNVAIGTTSTSSRLELKSSGTNTDVQRWMAFDGSRLARLTETSGGAGWFEIDNASGVAQALFRGDGGDSYLLSGNFGIGTSSPGTKLHVVNDDATTNALSVVGILTHSTTGTAANNIGGVMQFKLENAAGSIVDAADFGAVLTDVTNGAEKGAFFIRTGTNNALTEQFRIGNTGNVAIGTTTTTAAKFDIQGSDSTDLLSRLWNTNGSGTATFRIAASSNAGARIQFTDSSYFNASIIGDRTYGLRFRSGVAAGSEGALADIMTIAPGGNVGIGSTSPGARFDLVSSNTTTNTFNLTANSLTTGYGSYLSSNSTALSSGSLMGLDWSPGSATIATGDLLSLNVGSNGTLANIFNVKSAGSSVFSVSQTAVTSTLPVNFTSPGDVSIAYDINFTNPTASYINSAAPLYLRAGEVFNSSDLTLATYNKGNVIVDSEAFVSQSATVSGRMVIGTSVAPSNMGALFASNSATFGKALAILNQTESADIFTASNSGTTRFVIASNGNVGIGTTSTANPLTIGSDNTNGNGAYLSAGGDWTNGSSRDFKENINTVSYDDILGKINRLSISEWNYKNQNDNVKHIGPIAEDFYSIFGVGSDNKRISTIDPAGIALAGIKALSKQVDELKMQVLTSSISANFIAPETLSQTVDWNEATISGELQVLGRTTLSDVGITGKLVSGILTIDGATGEINALGALKLQANGFGSIDLFAGKVTVDNSGNIKTEGTLTATKIIVDTTEVAGASAGKTTIPAGKTSIDIDTTALTTDSLIFVTPESPVSIGSKRKDSNTFTITLEKTQQIDLKVNWWIVDATSN